MHYNIINSNNNNDDNDNNKHLVIFYDLDAEY